MNKIFNQIDKKSTFRSAIIASILFVIPAAFYLHQSSYTSSWLLYVGSFLFMIAMAMSAYADSKNVNLSNNLMSMIFAAHVRTIVGVALAALFCIILLFVFIPHATGDAPPEKILNGEPVTVETGKTHGLSFQLFFAATVINFFVGSFVGIIFPFSLKRSEKSSDRKPLSSELSSR